MMKLLIQIYIIWPYTTDSPWNLNEDGMKGLQSLIKRKQQNIRDMSADVRKKYLKTLPGAETNNLLNSASEGDYSDSESEFSDDEL